MMYFWWTWYSIVALLQAITRDTKDLCIYPAGDRISAFITEYANRIKIYFWGLFVIDNQTSANKIVLNTKGCDNKCGNFHPNTCRDSLKTRTCSSLDCRFFHLNGTKKTAKEEEDNSSGNKVHETYSQQSSQNPEQEQYRAFQKWQQSQNNSASMSTKPVFQRDTSSIENTLAEIREILWNSARPNWCSQHS